MPQLKSSSLAGTRGKRILGDFYRFPRRFLLLPLIAFMGASGASAPQQEAGSENGVFLILSGGRRVGTERYTITGGSSGFEATGELQLEMPGSPKISERSSSRLDPDLQPLSYERQQESPRKGTLTARFGPPETILVSQTEAGNEEQTFLLPDHDLVVLDTNFFHHYAFLIRLYDLSRPGPQPFNVFIPQEALPGTISMAFLGKESASVGSAPLELNHFQATTEEIKIEIWATPEGAIQRLIIPQANLEILRQK